LGKRNATRAAFHAIQENAKMPDGTPMPKSGKLGAWYSFHEFRRGFASLNAARMTVFELQTLMQHWNINTTNRYVDMTSSLNEPVKNLYVPQIAPRIAETG
jgi:integrase